MDTSRPDPLARQEDRVASCPEHGDFIAKHVVASRWTQCPQCKSEKAMQTAAEEQERIRKQEAEQHDALIARLRGDSGLIGRFQRATFATFSSSNEGQKKVATSCREFAETTDRTHGGLWLIGPPGTGKTHLGSAIVNHMIDSRSRSAAIHSSRAMVRLLRSTWRKGGGDSNTAPRRSETEMIEHLGSLDLLVVDEVGVSFGSDGEHVQLFDVLDLRYQNELPTVLLSNLTTAELKPVLGDRLYDRLREGATSMLCNWPSKRASAVPIWTGLSR